MLDRQEFHAMMTAALAAPRHADPVGGLITGGPIKSRIVEAHPPEASENGCSALLERVALEDGLEVQHVGDELWLLRSDAVVLFVDTLNPRFWQVHSTSPAGKVARQLKRLVTRHVSLDNAWLPGIHLEQLEGRKLWVKAAFSGDELLGSDAPERRLKARFEGDTPEELLELFAQSPRYARASAISGIGSIVEEPGVGTAHVVADYRGGFVFGAGSFAVAASVIWNTIRRYEQFVRALEERHRITTRSVADDREQTAGFVVDGDVAMIEFPERLADVEQLIDGLFSAKEPFRLWAVPRQVADAEWEANAVDLHVGHPIRLEITPYRVRVQLAPETCGNTLARLLANLQHHLDARATFALAA